MSKAEKLSKVFETATLNGKLVALNTEQAETFIDYMKDESKLLSQARVIKMSRPNKEIAKIFADGRFLHPGKHDEALSNDKAQKARGETIELNSKLVRGKIFMTDQEIEDNIEGEQFKATFMRIVAKKVANELEEISMYSRKVAGDPISTLDMFDGFKYRLLQDGNVLDVSDTGLYSDRKVSKEKFADAMKMLKTQYRDNLKYIVPSNVAIDYGLLFDTVADSTVRNELRSQILNKGILECPLLSTEQPVITTAGATTVNGAVASGEDEITVTNGAGFAVGDSIVINHGLVSEKVYVVIAKATHVLTLDRDLEYGVSNGATVHKATTDGADVILTNPLNMIYGIQTNESMSFETERVASVGFYYHFKMRLDTLVENPEASVLITNLKS